MSSTVSVYPPALDRALDSQVYSFRDPLSRVSIEDKVTRTFRAQAAESMRSFLDSSCYQELVRAGWLLPPSDVSTDANGQLVMVHELIENWNYPYEWSFSMLQDAALMHLDILKTCATYGYGLSDATSFNVTFVKGRPVFIDHGSFVLRTESEPWWAFTDYCEHFLYPLLTSAYTGAELSVLLLGRLGRLKTSDAYGLLKRHVHKKGVLRQLLIPHLAASKVDPSVEDVSGATTTAMTNEIYVAMLDNLRAIIGDLKPKAKQTTWSNYTDRGHYNDEGLTEKADFVERVAKDPAIRTVLDMGANDGYFSKRVSPHVSNVVAVDGDHLVIDALYRSKLPENVLPLIVDATNPTPALGWRSLERSAFGDRIRPDLVLSLAVLHHISLSGNVPLDQIVAWLSEFEAEHVVEFVHREDEKVQHLLSRKTSPGDFEYGLAAFTERLEGRFDVADRLELSGGTRTMLHLKPVL